MKTKYQTYLKPGEKRSRINVYISPLDKQKLVKISAKENKSISMIINELIEQRLSEETTIFDYES